MASSVSNPAVGFAPTVSLESPDDVTACSSELLQNPRPFDVSSSLSSSSSGIDASSIIIDSPVISPIGRPDEVYFVHLSKVLARAKILCAHFARTAISTADILWAIDLECKCPQSYRVLWLGSQAETDDSSYHTDNDSSSGSESSSEVSDENSSLESDDESELTLDDSPDPQLEDVEVNESDISQCNLQSDLPEGWGAPRVWSLHFYSAIQAELHDYRMDFDAANCFEAYMEDQYSLFQHKECCR
jgi:hypothetical protein